MELEFKKPTLLPNKLTLSGDSKAFAKDAAAGVRARALSCCVYGIDSLLVS